MLSPVITSFDALKVSYKQPDSKQRLTESLHQIGFAVLTDHPISSALIAATYDEWQHFFNSETKHCYTFDPAIQSGYFPFQTEQAKGYNQPDLKEFFHLYDWGIMPDRFSLKSRQLFHQMSRLAAELLAWIESLMPADIRSQLTMPLCHMIADSRAKCSRATLMRILHYPPLTDTKSNLELEGAVRAAPHEDINLITLLPAATASGLEILDHQGIWHAVPSNPGDIVINVGDMLQMASHGYFRSTTHRVINPQCSEADRSRYSMPLFLHPRSDVLLAGTTTAGDYLQQRLREIGLRS